MLAPCEVGYVGRTCCHLLQCLLFWMIDPEIWSALALSSRTLVAHRTLIQPGPLDTVWKHSSFSENAPLQQHCHWCHILYTCHPVINCPVPSLLHPSFLTLKHIRSHYPIPCCMSSTWKIYLLGHWQGLFCVQSQCTNPTGTDLALCHPSPTSLDITKVHSADIDPLTHCTSINSVTV